MLGHFACRWLPTFALALALGGCGALERKPEPTLASAVADTVATGAEYPQGIRPANYPRQLNLNVFGLSYHPDRTGTRDRHLDNELNPGLGLNYEFHNDARGVATLDAGFLKDSGRNWTKFAGAGYQFKLGDRWRLGADLLAIHSQTYNNGRGFVAPIPHLTYDFGPMKLNAIYVPAVREFVQFSVFSFYLTIPMGSW